jgi:hypothetical protein
VKSKLFFGSVFVLVAFAASCTVSGEQRSSPDEPSGVPMPGLVAQFTPSSKKASKCELDKWTLFPRQVTSKPSSSGFKEVTVVFGAENNSQHYGYIDLWGSYVTTEGGFYYEGTSASQGTPTSPSLPPGFIGTGMGYRYQVATSQNHLAVHIKSFQVRCVYPDGREYVESWNDPVVMDLDKDTRPINRPTTRPDNDIKSITEPFEVPNVGIFTLLDIHSALDGKAIVMRFRFTNANAGYETSGSFFHSYLIGDGGVTYYLCDVNCQIERGGNFQAGPGQSDDFEIRFYVPERISNPKLVLIQYSSGWIGIPAGVYNVPEVQ